MKIERHTILVKTREALTRRICDETLVIPVKGRLADLQTIFAFDGIADFVWQRIDGRRSLGAILDEVCAEFAVSGGQAEQDLAAFVADLRQAGLVHDAR